MTLLYLCLLLSTALFCQAYAPFEKPRPGINLHFSQEDTTTSFLQDQILEDANDAGTLRSGKDDVDVLVEQSIRVWEEDHAGLRHNPKKALEFVHQLAKRMSTGQPDSEDDLVQEGTIALMEAMHHYASLRNHDETFDQYAKRYILYEMSSSLEPNEQKPMFASLLKSIKQKDEQLQRTRSVKSSIANRNANGISPKIWRILSDDAPKKRVVSVESTVESYDPDEVIRVYTDQEVFDKTHTEFMWEFEDEEQVWLQPSISLKERIVDSEDLNPEDEAFQSMLRSDLNESLLCSLDEVELEVIRMRFYGEALSQREAARRLRTTKQFIQSIEKGAIEKLRLTSGSRLEPYIVDTSKKETKL
mmetsp:Transcript_10614/g.16262  ORF Transcript_10614/g.16262 Transcript_10614/m.16262 type:complete len:360 (+) Transcript_10614:211-1290(+)